MLLLLLSQRPRQVLMGLDVLRIESGRLKEMLNRFGQLALPVEDNADPVMGLCVSRVDVQRLGEVRQRFSVPPGL